MAGKGGGAWKVAYADFVTAMMAFFMVMWLTTQKEGVKEAVAGYFREPFATYKSNEKGAAATAKPVEKPMYGHTAQPQKRVLPKAGKDQDYQFTVLFANGVADLEADQQEGIAAFAPTMTGKLNRIEVRSHCLRQPLPEGSSYKDHWDLCYQRCRAVQDELVKQGIEPERIRLSQAEGNEPLALTLGEDELKLNSRVDVILLPDLAEPPWERKGAKKPPAAEASHGEAEHGESEHAHSENGDDDHAAAEEHESGHGDAEHAEHAEPAHEPAAAHAEPAHAESHDAGHGH